MSMGSYESQASGLRDPKQLAALLGIPWDTASESSEKTQLHGAGDLGYEQDFALDITSESPTESGGAGPVEISQMVDDANRELLTAIEMSDGKRQRTIAKTIRWLQFLEQRAQSLTENVRALVNRLPSNLRVSRPTSDPDCSGETADRLEWAFTAITRWIERRLPLAHRRESGARLNVDWSVPGARTWWADAEGAEPFLLRDLVRECLLVDGQFPAEQADPIADRILEDLRHGILWLPRLTRLQESTTDLTVLSYETLSSRTQPPLVSQKDQWDDPSAIEMQLGYTYEYALALDTDDDVADDIMLLSSDELNYPPAMNVTNKLVRKMSKWEGELKFTQTMPEVAAAYDLSIAEENMCRQSVHEMGVSIGPLGGLAPRVNERGPNDLLSNPMCGMEPIGYKFVEGGYGHWKAVASRDSVAALSARLAGGYHCRPHDVARRLREIAQVKLRTATASGDFAAAQRYWDAIIGIQKFMAERDR